MPKRILILPTSAGGGHLRAAQALELAFRELSPETYVKNIDILQLTNKTFRKIYGQGYLDFVNKAPHVLGYFYDLLDQPVGGGRERSTADRMRVAFEKLNMKPFFDLLHGEHWDLVINVHFLSAEIMASLKRKGEVDIPDFTVTTDFETHRLWVQQPCDHYFTATEEGAAYLQHWGVPAKDVSVTGIPIHPVFSQRRERGEYLAAQGLEGKKPIVLQLAGGFGVGPIETIFRGIAGLEMPLEIVVVAGRNEEVKKKIEGIEVPSRHRVKVMGFTDKIDELMAVADVVVSKPGGLTTSETLASGAAMAVVNPIPGQESRNSDFLLENGAAIKINNIATLPLKLGALLRDPKRLAQIKANAKALGKPRAAFDIARFALDYRA